MFNIKQIITGQRWLVTVITAIFASLILVSSIEAQDTPSGEEQDRKSGPSVSASVRRTPSSKEPSAKSVKPEQEPTIVRQGFYPPPVGTPSRNPFSQPDPSLQIDLSGEESDAGDAPSGADELSEADIVFNGINSGSNPPDTVGDVGPNHYIQMTNPNNFQVFEHDGTTTGPVAFSSLWDGTDLCSTNGRGDPIVVYDHLADRWLMMQFAFAGNPPVAPFFLCFALSKTETPDTVPANWYLWSINVGNAFPDYPKLGVWPDAYYMTTFEGGTLGVFALDRANMLNGNALQWVKFNLPNPTTSPGVRSTRVLPADLDGELPPAGSPGIFSRTVEDSQDVGDADDRIEIYEFAVDWANPGASTFTIKNDLRGAAGLLDFEIMGCNRNGGGGRDCVPVPGAGSADALSNRPMMQLKYRNFGSHETMVVNQTVDVAPALNALNPGLGFAVNNEVAGVRWYELRRNSGDANWGIYQQGTFTPQNVPADEPAILQRWMGSMAMDRFGNIALGYSVASDDVLNPGIRYAGRIAADPLGLLPQSEFSIVEGTISPAGTGTRWGDYSAMSVDPIDDCTFWYTTHITNGEAQRTRIASFHFNGCSADLEVTKSASPDPAIAGQQVTYTISVNNHGPLDATEVVVVDSLPDGFTYLADNVPGDQCEVAGQIITCAIGDIDVYTTSSFTITAMIGSDVLQLPEPGGPKTFDNLVEGSAAEADDVPDNDAFTLSTLVNELADLSVTKTCKPDRDAIVGEDEPFCEIIISNSGPSMAREVTLNDEITAGGAYTVDNVIIDNATGSCSATPDGDVECDVGDIDAGDSVTVIVFVNTELAIDINDTAIVATATPESDYDNNTATGQINFVVPSADLLVTKQCQPVTPAPAGSTAFCEIFVYNNGPQTAKNVVLDDQIASDGEYTVTDVTTSVGTCTPAPATPTVNADVLCHPGDIASGDTVSIVVNFTSDDDVDVDDIATATSETDDPDPNNNTATGSVTFAGVSDLWIRKLDNPDPVAAGTDLFYRLRVDNLGPSDAVNVVVSDFIPAGTLVKSAIVTTGSGNCVIGVAGDPARPTQCGLGTILSGDFAIIRITVFVLPDSRGVLHNDATVSSDYFDDDNGNNQITRDTTIIVVTDLVLSKRADHDPVIAGTELRYVIELSNGGPSTATGVMLTDTLPPETSWLKTKVLGGVGDCVLSDANPDVVTCTLDNMDPGETFTVVITVLVDPSVPDGTSILNIVDSTSDDGDNDHVEVFTLVNAEADLWIDKTGGFITQNPGKDIRYTLTVHNDAGCSGDDPQVCGDGGPSDALNVVVVDTLPATYKKLVVTFVSEDCVYDEGSHSVTCTTPRLAAGDTVFHEIEATPRGRLRAITNTAEVSSTTTDPDGDNNSDDMLLIVGGGGQKGTGE